MKDVKNRRMTLMAQIWLVNPCGPVKMSTVFTAENSEGIWNLTSVWKYTPI